MKSSRIYQTTHDSWISKFSGTDLLRTMLRCEHHNQTDIYKNQAYLSYPVGSKYLTAIDLISRPVLAKALRAIPYPAIGETLYLDESLFNYDTAGIDNLLACVNWLKEANDKLLAKKLDADKRANNLIMLYEDVIEKPLINNHTVIELNHRNGYAICLEILGVKYYFNAEYANTENLFSDSSKELYLVHRSDLFFKTPYNSAHSVELVGYIKHTPYIKFFARAGWKNKGHTFWLDIATGNISRATSTIKELAKKSTNLVEIVEIEEKKE